MLTERTALELVADQVPCGHSALADGRTLTVHIQRCWAPVAPLLDRNDNIIATLSMADYYVSLAEGWFGVPASEVIPGGTPVPGLFA